MGELDNASKSNLESVKIRYPFALAIKRLDEMESFLQEKDPYNGLKQDLLVHLRGLIGSSSVISRTPGNFYFFPKNNTTDRAQRITVYDDSDVLHSHIVWTVARSLSEDTHIQRRLTLSTSNDDLNLELVEREQPKQPHLKESMQLFMEGKGEESFENSDMQMNPVFEEIQRGVSNIKLNISPEDAEKILKGDFLFDMPKVNKDKLFAEKDKDLPPRSGIWPTLEDV